MKKIDSDYKLTIKRHKSSYSSKLLFMWLMELYFMTIARFILSKMGFDTGWFRSITLFLVASIPLISFLIHIKQFKARQYIGSILLFLLVGIGFMFTIIIHPEYAVYFKRPGYGIDRVLRPECALYAFLFFSIVDDPDELLEVVRKYAIFYYIYIVIMQFIPRIVTGYFSDVDYLGRVVKRAYSLSFGYSMLFPTIVFLYIYIRRKKIIYFLGGIFGGATIFLYGNRGALLMIVIFLGLMVISNIIDSKNMSRKTIKILFVILLVIITFLLGEKILQGIVSCLQSLGIESRTLEMLVAGEITNNSGRDVIWNSVIGAIRKGGIFGYGIFGDRPIVTPLHYVGYSHNIFLELLVSFGIIGAVLIIKICIDSYRMIFLCKDTKWRGLFIIFFSISFQLITSMSFWYVMEFWAAAAIAHKYFLLSKRK